MNPLYNKNIRGRSRIPSLDNSINLSSGEDENYNSRSNEKLDGSEYSKDEIRLVFRCSHLDKTRDPKKFFISLF